MTSEQFARVEQLFFEAGRVTPDQRSAWIDSHCADDPAVAEELRAMLGQTSRDDVSIRPLQSMMHRAIGGSFDPQTWIGRSIARYRIVELLGQGGMGIVFRAEQDQPVRRTVALKLIRPGMDSPEVIARFDSERQALAMMSHANVARVFDAGTTDDARHYFVMEYVPGEPITTYCDAHRLSTRDRLGLFMQVCDAVQHAHHKGIIHRDLKPTNVLVTREDDRAIPKVIDFGIAKAVEQPLTTSAAVTQLHQPIGTPHYMSPEQASMGSLDIDTRTDVYSLGVLLYELLAGARPFDSDSLDQTAFDEVRRIIREVDPPVPSSRLSSIGETIHRIAQQRQAEPSELVKTLRGDLDWITMKAMEKDRTRRYNSPAELSADVKRFLDYEPVTAGPPTIRYRVRKFVRRHRVGVLSGTLLVLALVGGIVGTTWQARSAAIQRNRAEKRFDQLRTLAGDFMFKVDQAILAGGATEGRKQLLTTAIEYLDALDKESADDPKILADLVRGYRRAGMVQYYGGQANLGDPKGALESYRKSLEVAQRWSRIGPDNPDATDGIANGHYYMSNAYQGLSDYNSAIASAKDAMEIWQALAATQPAEDKWIRSTANCWQQVAWNNSMLGNLPASLEAYEQFLKLREEYARRRPDDAVAKRGVAAAYDGMGAILQQLGRTDEAIDRFQQVVEISTRLMEAQPKNLLLKRDAAHSLDALSRAYIVAGKFDLAEQNSLKSLALRRALVDTDSTNRMAQEDLGQSYRVYADSLQKAGKFEQALPAMEVCLAIRQRLADANPDDRNHRGHVAGAWSVISAIRMGLNQPAEAIAAVETGNRIYEKLIVDGIEIDLDIENLSKGYQRQGDILHETDRHAHAIVLYTKAIEVLGQAKNQENPRMRATLAFAHARMGDASESLKNMNDARKHWQTALDLAGSGAIGFDAVDQISEKLQKSAAP